jgi:cobyrinic acid a,c-diamide synthase
MGIIGALRSVKDLKIVPFKKGPDYIDAGWMSVAAGNPCYNLDPFFLTEDAIIRSFMTHSTGDISVIEGNRGLYDGMDAEGSYSTAELSKLLKCPVILIVDCSKTTKTAAALVLGCMNLDKDVPIKGVVLNRISGGRHESVVREAVEKYCSIPVLGAIPHLRGRELPERHMGLTPHQEYRNKKEVLSEAEEVAQKYLDLDRILEIARCSAPLFETPESPHVPVTVRDSKACSVVRIGIIKDTAFQFYYEDNIEELQRLGAEIVTVNALHDPGLPDIDALYIGGGFPETNALNLAGNPLFRDAVRKMALDGLPIYAECGGLMFLGDAIIIESKRYPMAGIFPITFQMTNKPQAHGYTIVEVDHPNPFYPVGTELRGHEFHYSEVTDMTLGEGMYTAFKMKRGQGIRSGKDGLCFNNVLAAYTHVHALGSPEWAAGLINSALEFSRRKGTMI